MTKRQRFIITSILLSLGFVGIQLIEDQYKFVSIGLLSLFTLILFGWSLREGLGLNMTLSALILPFFFTIGVGLFFFLLPTTIYTRIPIVVFYGLGIYSLCLTSNIYSVAAIRTIALMRAARGVGFVLTLITFFLIFDAINSVRASLPIALIVVFLISIPMFLQGFWTIPLSKKISRELISVTLISSLVVGETAASLYFWPVTVVVGSLFLTVTCYTLLGLGQASLEKRLFRQTVREYLTVGILVFLGMFLATRWSG